MLHVWPRLRLIQEQRQALGIAGSLPDLDRLTAFAALMPTASVGSDGQIQRSVEVLRPNPARYPPPGYLEEQAEEGWRSGQSAKAGEGTGVLPALSESEWLGARLLRRARADGYVQALPTGGVPATETLAGEGTAGAARTAGATGTAARAGMFWLGRELAPELARSLVWEVIDATRLDNEQTNDPFVQTTIYVIGSLVEPLTSALMWPVLQEVITQLGRRQIARVTGLLATGSFAHGHSRLIEEAASHAALRELEALMGGVPGADGRAAEPAAFDTVYFLDREKSNQALASDALELSILAGNAIEGLLAAGGAELVDQRLESAGRASPACRYAILGAASDSVPVAESIAAAIAAEQKQALRAEVLLAGPRAAAPARRAGRAGDERGRGRGLRPGGKTVGQPRNQLHQKPGPGKRAGRGSLGSRSAGRQGGLAAAGGGRRTAAGEDPRAVAEHRRWTTAGSER